MDQNDFLQGNPDHFGVIRSGTAILPLHLYYTAYQ